MSSAKITLIGFYKLMDSLGDDLFKHMDLPQGIEKDIVVDNILLRGGEFEVLYSDPEFLQNAIRVWSRKWYRTFDKWITALNIDYNPLENYDRVEEWTDRNTGTVVNEGTTTDNGTVLNTGTVKNDANNVITSDSQGTDNSEGTGESSTLNKRSAFDTTTLQSDTSSDVSTSNNNESTTHLETSRTEVLADTRTDNLTQTNSNTQINNDTRTDDLTGQHTGRLHGNIGVTTSQQMLQSELDIAMWNIYEHISDIFLREFVLAIY